MTCQKRKNGVPSGLAYVKGIVHSCLTRKPCYLWFWPDALLALISNIVWYWFFLHLHLFRRALFCSIAWLEDELTSRILAFFYTILLICVLLRIALRYIARRTIFCHRRVWQFNEHRSSKSFKQRQLNQAITITLQLTEHANIFLDTYPVVVFSHLSLQPLLPCTRSQ